MRIVSWTRRLTGLELWQRVHSNQTRVGEMATGFDIFGETVRDWLEEPHSDEAELESLLLEANDDYESSQDPAQQSSAHAQQLNTASHSHSRFAPPKSEEEIRLARAARIPEKTRQDTKYCVNIWEAWKSERQNKSNQTIPPLAQMNNAELNTWLSSFALEVRKQNSLEYPPNSLHHISAGLQRHIREEGRQINLLSGTEFAPFQATLDGEMKRLQSLGIGTHRRQAEVITVEEEDLLWEKGQLGDANPKQLLDTMVFYCGLYFSLRSGKEHRQLCRSPCQIELVETPNSSHVIYREDLSKNHPGGLKGRNIKPKVVYHHENTQNPQRCFIRLFKKYLSLCASDAPADAFYLQPSNSPSETCWFSRRALGYHPLSTTVSRICKSAGITGYKTNHSLGHVDQQTVPVRCRRAACHGAIGTPQHGRGQELQKDF